VFAQITSVFAAVGGSVDGGRNGEIEENLTAVMYPHRRMKITELVKAGKWRTALYPRAKCLLIFFVGWAARVPSNREGFGESGQDFVLRFRLLSGASYVVHFSRRRAFGWEGMYRRYCEIG